MIYNWYILTVSQVINRNILFQKHSQICLRSKTSGVSMIYKITKLGVLVSKFFMMLLSVTSVNRLDRMCQTFTKKHIHYTCANFTFTNTPERYTTTSTLLLWNQNVTLLWWKTTTKLFYIISNSTLVKQFNRGLDLSKGMLNESGRKQ